MISVCMCTYNGQTYLAQQLESILNQITAPDEVIIYDDASTDDTPQVLLRFIADHGLEDSWKLTEGTAHKGFPASYYDAMELCREA
jgi:glycosyltransferase involved in cell wall biosynthesis